MLPIKDILRWFNKTDVVPTLEEVQKNDCFLSRQKYQYVKAYCTLPNLANSCLHKSTDTNFYSFTEADKDQLEKT